MTKNSSTPDIIAISFILSALFYFLFAARVKIAVATTTLFKRHSPDEVSIASRWSESVWTMLRLFRDVTKYRPRDHESIQRPAKLSNSTGNSVMILVYAPGTLKFDYLPHNYLSILMIVLIRAYIASTICLYPQSLFMKSETTFSILASLTGEISPPFSSASLTGVKSKI